MGKHESMSGARKGNKQDNPERRRRRRRIWLSGLATAVLASVLATSISGALPKVAHALGGVISQSRPKREPTPQRASSKTPRISGVSDKPTPADHSHSPICRLEMSSEYPLDSRTVRAWTFPVRWVASPSQIAQVNEGRTDPNSVNQDLYLDGGYALSTYTQLILKNDCAQAVTISDIWVSKSCQAPLSGTIFTGENKLSEPTSTSDGGTQLGLNLDSPDPEAKVAAGWNVNQWTQDYASGSLVMIPSQISHVFDIRAIALHSACRFSILIRAVYGGKSSIKPIDDEGQPFRVGALLPGVLSQQKVGGHPYAGYSTLYVGSDASPWHDGTWTRENPKTWQLAN